MYRLHKKVDTNSYSSFLRLRISNAVNMGDAVSSQAAWDIRMFEVIHSSFSILSDDRSKASSKTIPPHSAI